MKHDFSHLHPISFKISTITREYRVGRVVAVSRAGAHLCIRTAGRLILHYLLPTEYKHMSDREPRIGDYIIVEDDDRIRFDEFGGPLYNVIKPLLGDYKLPSLWRFEFWRFAVGSKHVLDTPYCDTVHDDGKVYKSFMNSNLFIRQ